MRLLLAAVFVGLVLPGLSRADEVLLKSGGAVRGKVVSEDEKEVVVQTDSGKVKIPRAKVDKVVRSRGGGAAAEPPPARDDGPARTAKRVLLFAFDGVEGGLLEEVAQRVQRSTGLGVELLRDRPEPVEAFVDRRRAFLPEIARRMNIPLDGGPDEVEAEIRKRIADDRDPERKRQALALLDDLRIPRHSAPALAGQVSKVAGERLDREGALGAVGLVKQDMCTTEANVLFGFSGSDRNTGVVSVGRFAAGEAPRGLLLKRVVVQVVSTTCGLFGLDGCKEAACARSATLTLQEFDRKPESLCRACRAKLDAAVKAAR